MNYKPSSETFTSPGFVLVKTVMAITILALSLTVSVKLLGLSAKSIQQNRQRTTALFLAQQCLEWTRNLRDTAWRQNLPWDCGFIPSGESATAPWEFTIDRDFGGDTGSCQNPLGYQVSGDILGTKNIVGTHFNRVVFAEPRPTEEVQLRCEVSWPEGSIDMTHLLTNWKE